MSPFPRVTLNKREYFRMSFLSKENHASVPNNSENTSTAPVTCGKNAEICNALLIPLSKICQIISFSSVRIEWVI